MMPFEEYDAILWDFNGTLFDDVDACIASVNSLLAARGLPTVSDREEYHGVFGFPVIDYYKRLGFDLEHEDFDSIARVWVAEYDRHSASSELCRGAIGMLERFRTAGLRQYVISATEVGMLRRQLTELGLLHFFDAIHGLDNCHAGSKLGTALEWRRAHPDDRALFIGDTTHDAEVAHGIGADCLLCAAGHQSRATLQACPDCRVIDSLEDLIR